jgi:hypothetical protein
MEEIISSVSGHGGHLLEQPCAILMFLVSARRVGENGRDLMHSDFTTRGYSNMTTLYGGDLPADTDAHATARCAPRRFIADRGQGAVARPDFAAHPGYAS